MNLSEVNEGSLLEIYINRDGYNYRVVSKIEVVTDNCICVSLIASRTKIFRFKSLDTVDIVYQKDDKTWKWHNVTAGVTTLEDGRKLHAFVINEPAEVLNRRSTFRLELDMPITLQYEVVRPIDDERESVRAELTPELVLDEAFDTMYENYSIEECPALLKDLSENGAGLQADVVLKKGDVVSFEIISKPGRVRYRAVVVRVKRDVRGYYDYYYGCMFIENSKNLIKFLYELQRLKIKKEKDKI